MARLVGSKSRQKFLWLAVETNEYEFPIYIEDSAQDLADKLGVKISTILKGDWNKPKTHKWNRKWKVEKVPLKDLTD